ncbi:MAG: hypothetical protein ACR2P1_24675 [Pseudomonadales bacterium]
MTSPKTPEALLQHLCSITALEPAMADHLVQEILHFYRDTAEEFIVRRHRELQQAGLPNTQIYQRIEQELQQRRFQTAPMSIRQIRRVIYG